MSVIPRELGKIVREGKERGSSDLHIRGLLKEYLQVYVLYFIYTSDTYAKNLIFTGGTCLRHIYGLERLSEDLDFDYRKAFDVEVLEEELRGFFVKKYRFDVDSSLKQRGAQILLKFPVLWGLDLAVRSQSDLLHVKIDLTQAPGKNYTALVTSASKFEFNFVVLHYDLPSLMAGKIHAVLTRKFVKGRDYFDLLWFMKKSVRPNLKMLSDKLGEELTKAETGKRLDAKVDMLTKKHIGEFRSDLTPLVMNPSVLDTYTRNYRDEYMRNKSDW